MSGHLSSQQIDDWVIGQRTREAEEHLRLCQACSDEVERIAGPLQLFGAAVRSWGEEMRPARDWMPAGNRWSGMWQWRMSLVMAAALVMIVVPVYRHIEGNRQAEASAAQAATAAQNEILLRQVEAGLARSVPAPMEPLAKLMATR